MVSKCFDGVWDASGPEVIVIQRQLAVVSLNHMHPGGQNLCSCPEETIIGGARTKCTRYCDNAHVCTTKKLSAHGQVSALHICTMPGHRARLSDVATESHEERCVASRSTTSKA